jgi:RNA polymerase sigma-70 factor, ECF subfamily
MPVELPSEQCALRCEAPQSATDALLIARLKAGDLRAFETMVRRYGGYLLAAARRVLGNDHDAQDAVQDAFSAAFNSIPRFRGDAGLSTWLYRIVVNAALMQLRRRRRRSEVGIEDLRFDADRCAALEVESLSAAGEQVSESRETREAVRSCIDQLPAIYRSVLILRDLEDLGTGEAAALLGVNANTVKIRLHRARQALKEILQREGIKREPATPGRPNRREARSVRCSGSANEEHAGMRSFARLPGRMAPAAASGAPGQQAVYTQSLSSAT